MNFSGLDSLEVDVINKKTKEWLDSISGELWNVVHKMIAKNYYLDKDDRGNIHPDDNGMLTFEVKQRKQLFKASSCEQDFIVKLVLQPGKINIYTIIFQKNPGSQK